MTALPMPVVEPEQEPWPAFQPITAWRHASGEWSQVNDRIAEEVAVALIYNGISHAVMLATPVLASRKA